MKINYFDLGVFDGRQIHWMVDIIFPDMKITNYSVYGIESNKYNFKFSQNRFKNNDKIAIYHRAISNENKIGNIYPGYKGNERRFNADSIFIDKYNVKNQPSEQVEHIIFSDWLKLEINDLELSFNILKWNIEGAEIYLIEDIVRNNLVDVFDIYCGAKSDLLKIKSMAKFNDRYEKLLRDNNINKQWFASSSDTNRNETIKNMKRLIEKGITQ